MPQDQYRSMSSAAKQQGYIIKRDSIQKPKTSALSLLPYGATSARSARVLKNVTSTMFNPTPYDQTSPTLCPRAHVHSQIQRPGNFPAIVRPRPHSPAAACPAAPQLATREGHHVARNDLQNKIKKGTIWPGFYTPAARKAVKADKELRRAYIAARRPTPFEHSPQALSQVEAQEESPLQVTAPETPDPVLSTATATATASQPMAAETSNSATAKPSKTKTKKTKKPINPFGGDQPVSVKPFKVHVVKRLASEVFNMNFSFAAPSRRRACDRTPEISPRTSFSSGFDLPINTPDKRQRIDSSDTHLIKWIVPFLTRSLGDTEKVASVSESQDSSVEDQESLTFSPVPAESSDTEVEIDTWDNANFSNYPFVHTRTEAHPGHPVDFSARANEIFGRASVPNEAEPDSYHKYLSESRRSKSLPAPRICSSPAPETKFHGNRNNKASRVLGFTSKVLSRKRPCTLENLGRTFSEKPTIATTSSNASIASSRTDSTTNDPSSKRFLTHVRKSLEVRALKKMQGKGRTESVFVDERETGWFTMGETPL